MPGRRASSGASNRLLNTTLVGLPALLLKVATPLFLFDRDIYCGFSLLPKEQAMNPTMRLKKYPQETENPLMGSCVSLVFSVCS